MQKPIQLTIPQARKLALLNQGIPISGYARGLKGTLEAIKHLGYVQIDTISVVERAHHHTLWNRVPHYRRRYPDKLVEQREVFEYWSHAAAYLPFSDYRFCLPRMNAIKSGQRHWYKKNTKLMKHVLDRISIDGPLQAKDFEQHQGFSGGMWEWGPIKQSIEQLFMQGDLLVTRRNSFQKVFDLADRVIPANTNTQTPSKSEYAHFLIERHLQAHGIAHLSEFGYLRQGMGPSIKQAIIDKIEAGDIIHAKINTHAENYFVDSNVEHHLSQRLSRSAVVILSPFDNLVIQRKRILRLFDFDYQLECYVPAKKRKQGYFCLPILWQGNLVARMDAKADRKAKVFIIKNLICEKKLNQTDAFGHYFTKSLQKFMHMNDCCEIKVPAKIAKQFNLFL